MALAVLLAVGAVVGWLMSIVWKQDSLPLSLVNMVLGSGSAFFGNLALGYEFGPSRIHAEALWAGSLCSAVAVSIVALLRRRFR
ncbi:MAG: GlsB/YeaQ/YmgE family stress response membrane protein [Erythrobacter sp.]|nr:GlsB/YeaQ/YmgE family stress response membrane protein [Erythrobacter sp.]